MAEQQAEDATITIDDVAYKVDDLSDNAKGQIQGIQSAEAEIKLLNIQVELVQTARNAYMLALKADLPANDE
jgi:hypothetical protein